MDLTADTTDLASPFGANVTELASHLPGLVGLEVSVAAGCGFGTSAARYLQIARAVEAIQILPRAAATPGMDATLAQLEKDVVMLRRRLPAVSHAWAGEADAIRQICTERRIAFTAAETHRASLCVSSRHARADALSAEYELVLADIASEIRDQLAVLNAAAELLAL